MGPERRLQPGPLNDTLRACAAYLARARSMGIARLPAYATSAVRKASNPSELIRPLNELGVDVAVLSEEEEGRFNLLGALARAGSGQADDSAARARGEGVAVGPAGRILVADPGGDSTEICADPDSLGWRSAPVASLPFGSVSLQERFGTARDNEALPWEALRPVVEETRTLVQGFPPARPFLGAGLMPAIRMNAPIQAALEAVNHRPAEAHGAGGPYRYGELEALTKAAAALDHAGRARLMDGEPLGKIDRTCYGFASWLGLLQALKAESFRVEPWGIKLGAALALNPPSSPGAHG